LSGPRSRYPQSEASGCLFYRRFCARVPATSEASAETRSRKRSVDTSEDSFIEVDGEVVQRDGTFKFEDGFEA